MICIIAVEPTMLCKLFLMFLFQEELVNIYGFVQLCVCVCLFVVDVRWCLCQTPRTREQFDFSGVIATRECIIILLHVVQVLNQYVEATKASGAGNTLKIMDIWEVERSGEVRHAYHGIVHA